jgi:surface protein
MTAQTCITNTGTTTLSGFFNIYTASTIGGPFGLAYPSISINSLTPPLCPYIYVVPNNTVQIKLIDDNLSKCELLMNVQDSNVCTICNLDLSSASTNTINLISVGNLTGTCSPMTDYRIYWYGPDSSTNVAYTSGFGTAFTPYQYTHPLTGSSAITGTGGVTAGTYIPVIDKVKISGITFSQSGFSASVATCLTNCLDAIVVEDPLSFQGIWTVSAGTLVGLPYLSAGIYSGIIDWGDGFVSANTYANRYHTYAAASSYTITITGEITGWRYDSSNNSTGRTFITEVKRWGPLRGTLNSNAGMFANCTNLVLTGVTDILDLSNITNMGSMFEGCSKLTTVSGMNQWDTSSVTSMSETFRDCHLFNQDIGNWDVSNVTGMTSLFRGSSANMVFNQDLSVWDVSNAKFMNYMFSFCTGFTNGGNSSISGWITSACTDMSNMFNGASSFNYDIGNWDVSKVTDMYRMFRGATNFDNGGSPSISGWTTSACTDMYQMFFSTSFDQPIESWNVSGVTDMSGMFFGATSFNQPLSGWNVSSVQDISEMFYDANAFDQNIGSWNVSNVTDFSEMFRSTAVFNNGGSPSISGWTVTAATTAAKFAEMFYGAIAFNQDLCKWNVSGISSTPTDFDLGASSWVLNKPNWGLPPC